MADAKQPSTGAAQTDALLKLLLGGGGGNVSANTGQLQGLLDQLAGLQGSAGQAQIEDIIKRAAEAFGTQKSAASGAGAYNSATSQLLRDNAAAEAIRAATLASQEAQMKNLGLQAQIAQAKQAADMQAQLANAQRGPSAGKSLGTMAAMSLLSPLAKKVGEKGVGGTVEDISKFMSGLFDSGGTASATEAINAADFLTGANTSALAPMGDTWTDVAEGMFNGGNMDWGGMVDTAAAAIPDFSSFYESDILTNLF